MENESLSRTGESYFLNLRFLLITCVFVGNAIEPLIARMPAMHALYVWIYTFHMPLFVLVTGYFAKTNLFGAKGRKALLQIAVQYVIFQSLYSLLDVTVFKVDQIHHSFFAPYLLLWFLMSHLFWRLAAMLMHRLHPLLQLAASIAASAAVGYIAVDGTWMSLSRTFVYLPFFIAGYHLSADSFLKIYSPKVRFAAVALSAALLGAAALWGKQLPLGWLYGSMTYGQLHEYHWYAGFLRLGMYALQLLASAAFLAWVPKREHRITDWGRRTLYVFLLHGLIVRLLAVSPVYDAVHGLAGASALLLGAVLLTVLLCQPFVKRFASPIIEPQVDRLLAHIHKIPKVPKAPRIHMSK